MAFNANAAATGNALERQENANDIARREEEDFQELNNAALDQVDPAQRSRHAVLPGKGDEGHRVVDIYSMGKETRRNLVDAALQTEDQDHEDFLTKLKGRMDEHGIRPPTVEVSFKNLTVEAKIYVGNRSEPTVLNSYRNFFEMFVQFTGLLSNSKHRFVILDNVSGTIKPGRMTLLLGPPGAGKSTLLKTLANKMGIEGCQISGDITYNGRRFDEFIPQRTAAYIEQTDLHLPELTVRETMNFAARVQGVGHKGEELAKLREAEKHSGIATDPAMDAFLRAMTIEGEESSIVTEYMLKILGLDVCADTVVGDAMLRGISGGQKKRVTTAEMVVGPKKTLFLDEISTGLDSSTTYQITKALRDFCHLREATILTALLQPQPESYDLFDDVLLMAEGTIIYHGPRVDIVPFFESCGFKCPDRKGVPDFLQEVTSKKDQPQYWVGDSKYRYVPVLEFADAFHKSRIGRARDEALATNFDESKLQSQLDPLVYTKYALNSGGALRACLNREWLLVKRNSFVYVFKAVQMGIVAIIVATLFLRTHIHRQTQEDASLLAGFLFFTLIQLFFNGIAEMTFTIDRMPVFFKQRDNLFFPAWSFVIPTSIVRIPIGLIESLIWTAITYFPVPLTLDAGRVFMFWLLTFLIHNVAVTLFRAIGALARNLVVANALGALLLLVLLLLGGFVLPKKYVHPWTIWFFWANPLMWAQQSLLINEFSAGHWQQVPAPNGNPAGLGVWTLEARSWHTDYWWVWVGVGVLIGYGVLFNIIVIMAHQVLDPYGQTSAMMSEEALEEREHARQGHQEEHPDTALNVGGGSSKKKAGSSQKLTSRRAALAARSKELQAARSKRLQAASQRFLSSNRNLNSNRDLVGVTFRDGSSKNVDPEAGQAAGTSQVSVDGKPTSRNSLTSMKLSEAGVDSGMVLPFEPMIMTFSDVHYFVPCPPDMQDLNLPTIHTMNNKKMLELLVGISGAFRPGVLTALMGVSGAGKTTLMDVLAGRKTGGIIEGDVRINGHPKVQETFSRISGYCEQTDVHSPQTNIVEALLFSASLRINGDIDKETLSAYVEEVMDLVELSSISRTIVGLPGVSGLSVEQRKRLTIAVELVANPSIIFMDEPTSGLDARAAAIVMRAVRNIVNTNRTIVCTIHQPSIDIFESFDELLLLKRGGRTIYAGPLGRQSKDLVAYFEAIPNVAPIKNGINPATWMLEISTPGAEERLGVNFADIYEQSNVFGQTKSVIEKASTPQEGTEPLAFATVYPRNFAQQVKICFNKFWITYWRTPEYNGTRFSFTVGVALLFGAIFWKLGGKIEDSQTIFNVLGCLYTACLFIGILNAVFVQPVISDERAVMYRERGAGMYGVIPWYTGLALVELIYLILQGGLYTCVVYFMCGFQKDAGKFFWFMLFTDLCLIYFTFYGIIAVAITPNLIGAAVISGALYGLFNLFAGFVMTERQMPGWWVWLYWADPVQWTLRGLITSQLGNLHDPVVQQLGADPISPRTFILETFSFESGWLGWDVLVLVAFCLFFMVGAGLALKKLNFQNR